MATFIDLFCGAGGFSEGLRRNNFEHIFSVEFDKEIAKTYRRNFSEHTLIEKDISTIDESQIRELIAGQEVDLIVGGPPCQGFSMAGMPGRTFIDDPRNSLFKEYIRVINCVEPKMFVFENVAGIARNRKGKTLNEIINAFEKSGKGYETRCKIVKMSKHGIPQNRRRFFLVGWKKSMEIDFKFPDEEDTVKTVKDAIGDLPPLKSGEQCQYMPNHNAMNHGADMLEKMSYIEDGGNRNQIPEDLRPRSGDVRKYIRYSSDEPSFCITGDMRKVFHYEQNRALTPRELARLQTFPDSFVFVGNSICIQQQIGNAVPPLYAEKLGNKILEALNV